MRKFRPVSRHVPPPREAAGYRASLAASPGAWEDLDVVPASVPALGTSSSGSDSHSLGLSPQGCGGWGRTAAQAHSRGTAEWPAGGATAAHPAARSCVPGPSRGWGRAAALASRQSSAQELSCWGNLEMSVLRLTCSRKRSI